MKYVNGIKKYNCTGCRACEEICPKKAITMLEDEEGFVYPFIDEKKCVGCNMCVRVCPSRFNGWISKERVQAFYGIASKEIRFNSSSGGAFTAIYNVFIEKGYSVYGVRFDKNLKVVHDRADTIEACEAFRKSKYVQSNTNGCYLKIYNQIIKGEKVLFSGTPCQVAALDMYLTVKGIKDKSNLVTIALLCHGVPNQRLFDVYIKELEEMNRSGRIINYQFKQKTPINGKVDSRSAMIEFENGKKIIVNKEEDAFLKGYYARLFYRPSCGRCYFARGERVSDITLADAWNIEQMCPNLNPDDGISLVLFHSHKAIEFLEDINKLVELNEISSKWALNSQVILKKPTEMHINRKTFFKKYIRRGVHCAVEEAVYVNLIKKVLRKIKYVIFD